MAFKLTPGYKGNPAMDRIKNLSACGGPGQPPCEPLFEKEKQEAQIKRFENSVNRKVRADRAEKKKVEVPVKETPVKNDPVEGGDVIAIPAPGPIAVPVKGGGEKTRVKK